MLGSIKSSDCSPYIGNDNDHGYLPICSIIFSLCKDRGFCKHKINSPIDEKMRDPAPKNDGSNKQKNSFCSEVHCETYGALLHHNSPKTVAKAEAAKSCKDGTATGNNTCI